MKIFGSLRELVAAVFRKNSYEITVKPNSSTYTGTVELQLPPKLTGNDVLVGQDVAQTISAKNLETSVIRASSRLDGAMVRNEADAAGNPTLYFHKDGGANKIAMYAPPGLGSNYNFVLPNGAGTANYPLLTDGSGNTSWTRITDASVSPTAAIADTKLATISTAGKVANSATTATDANTASAIVARNASGNFTAGTITATLSGTATNVTGIVAKANGGTGADNTNVTFPTTGTLVTRDASETLLNKTTVSSTALSTGALKLPTGTSAEQPGSPTQGMLRFNSTDTSFEGYDGTTWSGIGGGGTKDRITQASHGFVVGDTLYLNGSTYAKAQASAANLAEVVGVVSRVISSSVFELTLSGEISGLSGLTAGEVYFLSPTIAGGLTTTEPTTIGQVSVPVGVASSTTSLYVAPKRGIVIGGANARTELPLLVQTAAQDIQDITAYEAGELTGWVFVDATADLRFYVAAQFSRNGAGNNYNISYQTSGDTPPAGFSLSVTSGGIIQLTLASSITGITAARINYALNAPAVGATFPLSIDAGLIATGTVSSSNLPVAGAAQAGIVSLSNQSLGAGDKYFSGSVGIGTTSPGAKLDINGTLRVDTSSVPAAVIKNPTSTSYASFRLYNDLNNFNRALEIDYAGSAYASPIMTGAAAGESAGIATTGAYPLYIGTNNTARMAIDSSGNVLIGTTNPASSVGNGIKLPPGGLLAVVAPSSNPDTYNYFNSTAGAYRFYVNNAGTIFATNTTISSISDVRQKENIRDLDVGLNEILLLKPRTFDWKEGKGKNIKNDRGFIAQEFEEIFPDLIDQWKEKTAEEEEPYKAVRQDLIPVLVKAIQELKEQLDEANAKIAALEAK